MTERILKSLDMAIDTATGTRATMHVTRLRQVKDEVVRLEGELKEARRILFRIAGGDGYYPELARTCLHMTEH